MPTKSVEDGMHRLLVLTMATVLTAGAAEWQRHWQQLELPFTPHLGYCLGTGDGVVFRSEDALAWVIGPGTIVHERNLDHPIHPLATNQHLVYGHGDHLVVVNRSGDVQTWDGMPRAQPIRHGAAFHGALAQVDAKRWSYHRFVDGKPDSEHIEFDAGCSSMIPRVIIRNDMMLIVTNCLFGRPARYPHSIQLFHHGERVLNVGTEEDMSFLGSFADGSLIADQDTTEGRIVRCWEQKKGWRTLPVQVPEQEFGLSLQIQTFTVNGLRYITWSEYRPRFLTRVVGIDDGLDLTYMDRHLSYPTEITQSALLHVANGGHEMMDLVTGEMLWHSKVNALLVPEATIESHGFCTIDTMPHVVQALQRKDGTRFIRLLNLSTGTDTQRDWTAGPCHIARRYTGGVWIIAEREAWSVR